MSEYINRQILLDSMGQEARAVVADCDTDDMTVEYALEMMENAMRDCVYNEPTADVAPVRHGEWKRNNYWQFECTNCKDFHVISPSDVKFYKFCPNCGTKMDGGEQK